MEQQIDGLSAAREVIQNLGAQLADTQFELTLMRAASKAQGDRIAELELQLGNSTPES